MPRSLASGDYSLVMAIESGSRPNSWYRVLADRQSGALSCDCPKWIFNLNQRTCQHTDFAAALVSGTPLSRGATVHVSTTSPLLSATQQQWPGLRGTWQIEEADTRINTHPTAWCSFAWPQATAALLQASLPSLNGTATASGR